MAAPALAGDKAMFNPLGYDPKGHYFAFEEYGVSDGSGFAYDSVYVVDLQKDNWVLGTPMRTQAVDESETLDAIRTKTLARSKSVIDDLGITAPADLIAQIGDGILDPKADTISFGIPSFSAPGAVDGHYKLSLKSFPAPAAVPCETWFSQKPLGYQLSLSGDGADRVLHGDDSLPQSRGCPMAYRLFGVYQPFEATDLSSAIAIISVFPRGFEGPDRRFLAVPLTHQ